MRRYNKFNPKRRIAVAGSLPQSELDRLAEEVTYSGNPEHKRSPGDFGLIPPASPRRAKTLCDICAVFRKDEALGLLREGLRRGSVSEVFIDGWPKQIWAITKSGIVLEAQRDGVRCYHGYPLAPGDAFSESVVRVWKKGQ